MQLLQVSFTTTTGLFCKYYRSLLQLLQISFAPAIDNGEADAMMAAVYQVLHLDLKCCCRLSVAAVYQVQASIQHYYPALHELHECRHLSSITWVT
jgi:hypothetical protein